MVLRQAIMRGIRGVHLYSEVLTTSQESARLKLQHYERDLRII
jgi:hypothetical protein